MSHSVKEDLGHIVASLKGSKGYIVVTARVEAQPGKADELAQWFANIKTRANSDAEPGNLAYDVARSGDQFAIFEKYANYEALVAHTEGNLLFQEYSKLIDTLMKSAEPAFWPNSVPDPMVKF